jgi:hypothetical protein
MELFPLRTSLPSNNAMTPFRIAGDACVGTEGKFGEQSILIELRFGRMALINRKAGRTIIFPPKISRRDMTELPSIHLTHR